MAEYGLYYCVRTLGHEGFVTNFSLCSKEAWEKKIKALREGRKGKIGMKVIKEGGHRLFEEDEETSRYVREMLQKLKKEGMDAVRKFSREFDDWNPPSFELSETEIREAIDKCDEQLIKDTDFCQQNVRRFAEAQLGTMLPLEVEIIPGVILGHKHIPVAVRAAMCQAGSTRCSVQHR